MAWPAHPVVHEVFTWVWLDDLARALDRRVTLADVPAAEWDRIGGAGFDAVWLMGVWERSAVGAAIAGANASMRAAHAEALPDVTDADVVGSAYCIRDYHVDPHLGGDEGLAVARAELADRGVRLVLDFVPNHVAPDHPWTRDHPERFVAGTEDDLARDGASFLRTEGGIYACGRDPYFPAWPEVVQLDGSVTATREAAVATVQTIAERADGVRCDMAMLMLDDVFVRTWGDRAKGGPSPDGGRGYWPTVIEAVRRDHPDFVFWAEAYWDLEPVLVAQGFDACYDKRLYDRLVHHEGAASVRAHLGADPEWQRHTVRFVENHDEPRAAAVLAPAAYGRVAATVALTLPGVALVHEGQAVARRVRVPVTLGRRPVEAPDGDLYRWYGRFLAALAGGLRAGTWATAPVEGWPDNTSADHLLAWTWTAPTGGHLVVVNCSDGRADGRVRWSPPSSDVLVLTDALSGDRYERDLAAVTADGLYVALDGYGVHVLAWTA